MDIIAEHDISTYGFQAYDLSPFGTLSLPLDKLNQNYGENQVWEELFRRLNDLGRKNLLKDALDNIDPLNLENMETVQDIKRSFYILSFIATKVANDNGGRNLPKFLNDMVVKVLNLAGFEFHNYYYTSVMYNWSLIDTNGPLSIDNIRIHYTLSNHKDEETFYKIHVMMESYSSHIIKTILRLKDVVKDDNHEKIIEQLNTLEQSFGEMKDTILKIGDLDYGFLKNIFDEYELANFSIEYSPIIIFINSLFHYENHGENEIVLNKKHNIFLQICFDINLSDYIEKNKYYDYNMKNAYDDCLKMWTSFHVNYLGLQQVFD